MERKSFHSASSAKDPRGDERLFNRTSIEIDFGHQSLTLLRVLAPPLWWSLSKNGFEQERFQEENENGNTF